MADRTQPRYTKGELVMYMGSVHRMQGWLFRVTTASRHSDGHWLYTLHEDTWGQRLLGVRETSLRGPEDG